MLHECGVGGYLINMSSLYDGNRVCVRLGSRVGEYFEVRKGLRHGCVMSLWLLNILFDRVVREVNKSATSRVVKLKCWKE